MLNARSFMLFFEIICLKPLQIRHFTQLLIALKVKKTVSLILDLFHRLTF